MKVDTSDIRNQPAYGPAEAARYLRLPAATLRTWLVGRAYPKGDAQATFHPLIKPASTTPLQVSFYNLIEAHVLRALRTDHGVALAELRKAIAYAEGKLHLHRLLLSPELRTHAGQVSSIGMWNSSTSVPLASWRCASCSRIICSASNGTSGNSR